DSRPWWPPQTRPCQGRKNPSGAGYTYLHHAVDGHSRLAYSEILGDERKDSAAAFWTRASAFFTSHEITAKRVLTDHGSCYRSQAFTEELGPHVTHKRTRPYRPLTNGTVERFNHTLAAEWAYTRTYPSGDAGSAT